MEAHIIPLKINSASGPAKCSRAKFYNFFDKRLDEIEDQYPMNNLNDISHAIFKNRSDILGQLALSFIEKNFSFYLNQTHCDCPICKKTLKAKKEKRKRELETLIGNYGLYRPYFYCNNCNKGYFPLDEALGLSDELKQYDVQDVGAYLTSELPYETASNTYEKCTGQKFSSSKMHETTQNIAKDLSILDVCPTSNEIEKKIDELSKENFRRPVMMLGIDGAHAPTRLEPARRDQKRGPGEWKEAKGFRLYLIDSDRIAHLISWHQIQDDKELGKALSEIKEANLIPEGKVRLCVIGDGAPWIWNRVKEVFPSAKEVLDFYHCSEYVHKLANAQYGKGSKKAQEWVEATFTRLFDNRIEDVLAGLRRMKASSDDIADLINGVIRYLDERKDKLNYGAAKRGGYHIGSGAIESSNKFICNVRLKRSGAWWYPTNANNILKLRCAKYNGTYERIVEKYMREDQERIKLKNRTPKS